MIDVSVSIDKPIEVVWEKYTSVDDVKNWSFASDDWAAEGIMNELEVGGMFKSRNYAKDGSAEFDLEGKYTVVLPMQQLSYVMADGRAVKVMFHSQDDGSTRINQSFEPESENPEEMQRNGWQAYLNNFKRFVENR